MKLLFLFIIYQTLSIVALPFLFVYLVIRKFKNKPIFGSLKERIGWVAKTNKQKNTIWFHAVSVGEILSIQYIIKQIKEKHNNILCYVTTGTLAGKKVAQQQLTADKISFLPYDFFLPMLIAFIRIRPKTIVFVEGKTDTNYLMAFAKKFQNVLGITANFNYPIFETMDGKGDAFKFAKVIKKLQESKEKLGIKFLITVDKDEQNNAWLKKELDAKYWHIWDKRQIENYLLDHQTLAQILDKDAAEIKAELEAKIDSQKEDSLHRFIKELFFDWKLPDIQTVRKFLDENKGKNFEEYETKLEQMFSSNFIALKNRTKADIKNIEEYFAEKWEKEKWDLCDGKKVLSDFRQDNNYSFQNEDIVVKMANCPEDIRKFWLKVLELGD